ncbi:GNAT family N-acetyltransferase [Microbacterium aquimaris]|uniref:GNAT family N-acetyltransferase n=1 Tax=Microbacterium aquimaris TaxID=459816 RepID=A0ABU5N6D0_9MICO|nr:GNAT family N-acetyltransferase [Microbacterium aquimaris]MDZ8161649.1 GNAT family N-acetyltransferase [Microbacterium aquimaris]
MTILADGRQVDVVAATGRFAGFFDVVGVKKPGGRGCWCMAYRDSRVPVQARADHMRAECATSPGPGVLAYVDGQAAGWCSVAPRSTYRRLMNSRTIPFVDDADPWSVVCFVVRPGFRGHGLMHHLLAGAIAHVDRGGGGVMEGYPGESGARMDRVSAYIGTTALFERAGFERVTETASRVGGRSRWLMRRTVAAEA